MFESPVVSEINSFVLCKLPKNSLLTKDGNNLKLGKKDVTVNLMEKMGCEKGSTETFDIFKVPEDIRDIFSDDLFETVNGRKMPFIRIFKENV